MKCRNFVFYAKQQVLTYDTEMLCNNLYVDQAFLLNEKSRIVSLFQRTIFFSCEKFFQYGKIAFNKLLSVFQFLIYSWDFL